ncbi:MAG: carboxylesterase/lipase family protein [Clostridia bacterium]|nr:carboxylesterase/lipase family protein [Clostridia bacterium]
MKSFRYDQDFAVVDTTAGKIRGFEHDGILTFRGVKYATAKRFHAPEPIPYQKGVTDATSYGYVCPLLKQDEPKGEIFVPHRFWPQDEDCLNLNVWTPALDGGKRPVLFWLHGGGYFAGSSIEHIAYDGHNMALHGDAVVVSINHRLNILGYFDLSDFGEEYANSANAGGDDIIMALKWVHDNISAFGGDPDNVTIFGQSGGGGKVTTLLQSPAADGLYAKGFNMSGVLGLLDDAKGSGKELAEAIMKELKAKSVKELEKVPYAALAGAYNKLAPEFRKAGKYVGGAPKANKYYLGNPAVYGFRKETKDIPLLVGSVFGEFASFGPPRFNKHEMSGEEQRKTLLKYLDDDTLDELEKSFIAAYPERKLIDLIRLDTMFRHAIIEYLKIRAKLNSCTYSYMFNMDQPIFSGLTPWHCCDIPYVFHNIELVDYPQGSLYAETMQKIVFESVMAFARTGNPGTDLLPAWPACTAGEEHTMLLDEHSRCLTNYDHELIPAAQKAMGPVFTKIMADLSGQTQH